MKPEEAGDTGGGGKEPLSKEETIEFLNEETEEEKPIPLDKEKKPIVGKEVDSEEKEDEEEIEVKDELDELEEELEEPDEEKLELATPERKRDILAKYPKLFKDFPNLEKAYYREQAFTEVLGTIEDAKDAVAKADILNRFEADLAKGNLEPALKAAKSLGENTFNKAVNDYLPNLARVDRDAYFHVVGNIVRTTITNMIEAGKDGDKDLIEAAKIVNKFIFGNDKINAPYNLGTGKPENNEEDKKVSDREQQLIRRQFENARDDINTRATNQIKSTILANIDPKDSMPEYVKKVAAREAQEKLEGLLQEDRRLGQLIDKLWEASLRESFSKSSLDKIKSAYLSRAKTLLPGVIKQARNEALKGLGKRVKEDEGEDTGTKKGSLPVGRTSSTTSTSTSGKSDREKARAIPANVSNKDYLMQD